MIGALIGIIGAIFIFSFGNPGPSSPKRDGWSEDECRSYYLIQRWNLTKDQIRTFDSISDPKQKAAFLRSTRASDV